MSTVYWLFGYLGWCILGGLALEKISHFLLLYSAVNNVQACHGVDRAHPDGGLLSLSVVHPACEQSNTEERERGTGGGEHSCHSATPNLSASAHRQRHLWLEVLFEPHSETEGVCVWESLRKKKTGSSAKVPLSATLTVIIQNKSNHLYQLTAPVHQTS